jgi:hypothetical protein
VEDYLAGTVSAGDFIVTWQALEVPNIAASASNIDFAALANRIKRGEIALFLGSDLPRYFDPTLPDATSVVTKLAQQASYSDFSGSLSIIAEYYQMKTEYGHSSLVYNLRSLLPAPPLAIPLYDLLASVTQPLVLISAGYDALLEHTFRQKGKKYVVISTLVGASLEADMGKVLLEYSDRVAPDFLRLEQEVSQFDLLVEGYSLIYKVRGSLVPGVMQYDPQRNPQPLSKEQQEALTLSEEDYFTFARYMDRLIPAYVVKQLNSQGLLFLGYTPHQWEDRLIANALLYKRRSPEPPYTVGPQTDRFVETYWGRRGVYRYTLDLADFVQQLGAHFP